MKYLRSGYEKQELVMRQFVYYMKKYTKYDEINNVSMSKRNFKQILDFIMVYKDILLIKEELKNNIYNKIVEADKSDTNGTYNFSKYKHILYSY
jgi:hypothetical protein